MKTRLFLFFLGINFFAKGQTIQVSGYVKANQKPLQGITVTLSGGRLATKTDSLGYFLFKEPIKIKSQIRFSAIGYQTQYMQLTTKADTVLQVDLQSTDEGLNEVVITGTQKEVNRLKSPVPVEVYDAKFFQRNPTACFFDAMQNVNGVRPQLNCNVCNTGDIHINGMEGPYTMVLIDGMPIVSSLSTVYGLSGIPSSLVERIEVVKGPASSLYGSEAVGGLINIITKKPNTAPIFSFDIMASDYKEFNNDIGFKFNAGKKATALTGVNYYKYGNPVDVNNDGFTDITLQDRVSVFQKWDFKRPSGKVFSLAGRFMYEDRWGGQMDWNKSHRGGNELYGESIYTNRYELIGNYQLPTTEKMFLAWSVTDHRQDSRYGDVAYIARQNIAFTQWSWDKNIGRHDLLFGTAFRYTFYDDNTAATASASLANQPERVALPGAFVQDEIKLDNKHALLVGFRYDYHSKHGSIFTPRLAYKFNVSDNHIIRFNAGTGFRVVNLFSEDHAALTGAREVIVKNYLKPERTLNFNLNTLKRFNFSSNASMGFEFTAFYTHFYNRIVGDFETNPNQIIYDNLEGFGTNKGFTFNYDINLKNGLKVMLGTTYQDVSLTQDRIKTQQILTEKFMGVWSVSYKIQKLFLNIDYTGNIYGPMRLPLLGDLDPRPQMSPTWSIQNIQFIYDGFKNFEIYGGVKNLLDFMPHRSLPFLIPRSSDPFDKNIMRDTDGKVMPGAGNPYGLSFDTSYAYAPNQGIRGFLGIRYQFK